MTATQVAPILYFSRSFSSLPAQLSSSWMSSYSVGLNPTSSIFRSASPSLLPQAILPVSVWRRRITFLVDESSCSRARTLPANIPKQKSMYIYVEVTLSNNVKSIGWPTALEHSGSHKCKNFSYSWTNTFSWLPLVVIFRRFGIQAPGPPFNV